MNRTEDYIVNTTQLAKLFGVSERQIEKLVTGGVIESCGTAKALRFDLQVVVPQYAAFLQTGISLREWCPDT